MVRTRIIATLKFFDFQNIPLTLFEIHKFFLNDLDYIKNNLDEKWEVRNIPDSDENLTVSISEILLELNSMLVNDESGGEGEAEIKEFRGFYYLKHRDENFVKLHLDSYKFSIIRERRIKKFGIFTKLIPFVRGVGLVGSQAMGQFKKSSDIDLLVLTDKNFMWLSRLLITFYFQIFGVRRHDKQVANRFCLNHYIAGIKYLERDRNIYTASEYLKMRPLYESDGILNFRKKNENWIQIFFPNSFVRMELDILKVEQNNIQVFLEKLFQNKSGKKLEQKIKFYLSARIKQDDFIVVGEEELSFHPHNRKSELFKAFFEHEHLN